MSETTVHPLKPEDVGKEKLKVFPSAVFGAFNEMIARNFSKGSATVIQDEVVALMVRKGLSREEIHKNGWLNIEEAYKELGWKVEYDKPAYNETYPATFTFRKKGR